MKNKRLAIILSIFFVLTFFVVLGSTVFKVQKIEIQWNSTNSQYSNNDNDAIIKSAQFKKDSVFTLNKQSYIDVLEEKNPYIKVLSIETVFPNKLVVHLEERSELYALVVKDSADSAKNVYVVLDKDLKVLEMINGYLHPNTSNPIILTIEDQNYTDKDFTVGKKLNVFNDNDLFKMFDTEVKAYDYETIHLFKEMSVVFDTRVQITAKSNHFDTNGEVTMIIEDAAVRLPEKIQMLLSVFDIVQQQNIPVSMLTVYVHNNEIIVDRVYK